MDRETAEAYASVYTSLRKAGTPIPANDMWIAATALQHGLGLFTYDAHFKSIPGLVVEKTVAELTLP